MFCVINTVNVKTGFGVPELQDGAQRSQSRAPAGSVVGGLEAPGPHPGGGTRGLREVCHAVAFRARRGGRGVQCNEPAGSLHRREPLSQDPLPGRHLVVHRRAFQSPHGPAPRHPEHARALESCAGSGGVHRRAGVDRRRRRGLPGLAGRQEGRPGAARAVAGHARQARQLRCSPLPQGRTPRGQHVGSCCLCPTSLCSGDGAAPAGAERSGLPVACVKLIAGKREHFLGLPSKVGIPTLRPAACRGSYLYQKGRPEVAFDPSRRILPRRSVPRPACRGPHLYPKVRPEIAFDPSRRICLAFRPESVGGWGCVQTDTTGRSVPRPAGALTCIRRGARKWPLIRPAGFARRSVPLPDTLQPDSGNFPVCSRNHKTGPL